MSNLKNQIKDCKLQVQYNKIARPYIYPEYNDMLDARLKLEDAKLRYHEAKKAWRNLGR